MLKLWKDFFQIKYFNFSTRNFMRIKIFWMKKVSQNSHCGLRQRWKKSKGFLATSGLGLKFLQKWRSRTWKKLFFVCKWILGLLKLHKITNFLTMEVQQFRFSLKFFVYYEKIWPYSFLVRKCRRRNQKHSATASFFKIFLVPTLPGCQTLFPPLV